MVIQAGALKPLKKLLQNSKSNIVKEATWTISNITAGTSDQIQQVITADIFPIIQTILERGDFKSQKEAAWVVTNTTTGGKPEQVVQMVNAYGIIIPFCRLLDSKDARTVKVVLTGITNLLELADQYGGTEDLCRMIEENGFLDQLEQLQEHENEDIYRKTLHIVDKYFSEGEVMYCSLLLLQI